MRPRNFINLTGQRFGMLLVEHPAAYQPGGQTWNCLCNCGKRTVAYSRNLRLGRTMSCGCTRVQKISAALLRHGHARRGAVSAEHRIWRAMIDRCTNPLNKSYCYYGAIGVSVCERWRGSFVNFISDMGARPSGLHSIDRYPDNAGNYEPGNCRWATPLEQRHNRRDYQRVA